MSDHQEPLVKYFHDSVAVLRFNVPQERNPLSTATLNQLKTELSAFSKRSDVKAIIFTGTDDVFASGANIRELIRLDSGSAKEFAIFGQHLFQAIAGARQLTIAAINGHCIGGALDLALACDMRVASKHAVFAHPGARLGIITGWGGTQRLPRTIGRARALEFLLTARRMTSAEAFAVGLISCIADPVLEYALQVAHSAAGSH